MIEKAPTVALAMISNDIDAVQRIYSRYRTFFDEMCVTIASDSKETYEEAQKRLEGRDIKLSYFKWCDDFAAARNYNFKQVTSDFVFWMDSDDDLDFPEELRMAIAEMQHHKLDAYYMLYVYGYNEDKEPIAVHWRERIIRKSHPFKWVGAVHETLISEDEPKGAKFEHCSVLHAYKDYDEQMKSAMRNHKIMENLVKNGDEDPRTLYYLGRSYFLLQKYRESAQTLLIYTGQSGWDEQKYDAWMKIGDALIMMDEHDKAINANLEAVKLNPACPDAYLKLGDLYLALEQPSKAVEWTKLGLSKPPQSTLEIVDPTLYTYRPFVTLAMAYFSMAKLKDAKTAIENAAKFEPNNKLFKNMEKTINEAYKEDITIRQARVLGEEVIKKGDAKKFLEGLPPSIRNDLRLRPLRVKAYPPKVWPKNSIVFYCGESWEEWGYDTLANGMGGSEEAVTYLSEELAKLGWDVTIYNQRAEELTTDSGVKWVAWETFNPDDTFSVIVAWRNPHFLKALGTKANVKAIDMHDTPIGHLSYTDRIGNSMDVMFLKGEYQRTMGDRDIPEDKCAVISNGIVPAQFDVDVPRQTHKVIYASSADRGLDLLVREIWPKVKEQVPDAELVWAYGWQSFDSMHKDNPDKMKWKWELKRDMHKAGVKELGRLSHEDLAKEFYTAQVWAYPTSFPEINCITALKAQAAGCDVVTSGFAALQETVVKKEEEVENIHLKPEKIKDFTNRLINTLKKPTPAKELDAVKQNVLNEYSWSAIAAKWDKTIKGVINEGLQG